MSVKSRESRKGDYVTREFIWGDPVALDDFGDAKCERGIKMHRRLREQAAAVPDQGWTFYACKAGDDDTEAILDLWRCGLVRIATVFEAGSNRSVCHMARPA